jgi:rfaE bifunctional protein kinase chain/domain
MMTEALQAIVPLLAGHTVLVLGDVILDEYLIGTPERISREAPIPVLELTERRYIPGGAANPASNILSLGSHARQIGLVGEDNAADRLRDELSGRGIDISGLLPLADRPTTLKTRILAKMGLRFPQQIARVDTVSRIPITIETEEKILDILRHSWGQCQALLISDYQSGLLTQTLVERLGVEAHQAGLLRVVDAQGHLEKYRGFDVVKCNADDARAVLRRDLATDHDFAEAARYLSRDLGLKGAMVITRGAAGATIATAYGGVHHCPSPQVSDVYDTVGAGDTTIAVMTLALISGASYRDAVMLANYASGIVVRHVGNYTPSQSELREALIQDVMPPHDSTVSPDEERHA